MDKGGKVSKKIPLAPYEALWYYKMRENYSFFTKKKDKS